MEFMVMRRNLGIKRGEWRDTPPQASSVPVDGIDPWPECPFGDSTHDTDIEDHLPNHCHR